MASPSIHRADLDAWSDGEDGFRPALDFSVASCGNQGQASGMQAAFLHATPSKLLQSGIPQHVERAVSRASSVELPVASSAPMTLKSICAGCLALYTEELVQLPSVDFLPVDVRAILLAVARRRKEATAAVVLALVHSCWTTLDMSGCGDIKPAFLELILKRLPLLTALDLSGCQVTDAVLRTLGRCCQDLQVLRLGGQHVNETTEGVWDTLRAAVDGAEESTDPESWEHLDDSTTSAGRLSALSWLLWPDIPPRLQAFITRQWPKVRLNPELKRTVTGRLLVQKAGALHPTEAPVEADAARPLDESWAALAGPQAWHGLEHKQPVREHIAARFRRVLDEVEGKNARRRAKQLKREQRSALASKGVCERGVEQWLDEF